MSEGFINILLWLTYLLIFGCVAGAIYGAIIGLSANPKSSKNALIGVGLFLVVFLICYAISDSEVLPNYVKYGVDSSDVKIIGGVLRTMYVFGIMAIVGAVYAEVSKAFK